MWCGVLALLLIQPGCVRRRLMVRTTPPGAMVYVDNQLVGTTPCATDFTYYGTREIRLVKPGYETLTVNQPIPTPWYEIPPLDFVSENLVPKKIQDFRTVSFDMVPQVIVPTEQLLGRAEEMRLSSQRGSVLPPPVIGGATGVPTGSLQSSPLGTLPVPGASQAPETLAPVNSSPTQNGTLPSGGQLMQ